MHADVSWGYLKCGANSFVCWLLSVWVKNVLEEVSVKDPEH